MDLNTLATDLRSQAAKNSTIVLDETVFAESALASIRAAFALADGKNLTIVGVKSSDIPNPTADGALKIKAGTTSVLKQSNVPVGLTFTMANGALQSVIVVDLPEFWKFNDSFAGLNAFPFDLLDISRAHFVYTTTEHSAWVTPDEPTETIPLEPGLNFLSRVTFKHFDTLHKLLGSLIGNPLKFYGALENKAGQSFPVGRLRAPLGAGSIKVGVAPLELSLDNPAVAVRIGGATEENPLQEIDLLVETTFDKSLQVAVGIPVIGGALEISTAPLPHSESIDKLIKKLPGGQSFTEYIPDELSRIFDNIGLNSFSMIIAPEPKVTYLGLSISTSKPWSIIPNKKLDLEKLSLEIETIDPRGLNWARAHINATAEFLPEIFKGQFAFTAGLEKQTSWQVSTVSGTYYGSVSLGKIVEGLLPNSSAPEALSNIQFSDFAVTANRETLSYSFSGRVETAFTILDRKLTSALSLAVNKTTNSHTIHLGGSFNIGAQVFTLSLNLGQPNSKLTATWRDDGTPLSFADIASTFGWDSMPALPEGLDLALKDAEFNYDFENKKVLLSANSVNYGQIVFASVVASSGPNKDKRVYLFSLDVPLDLKFSKLPVVGENLPTDIAVEKLQIIATSTALEETDLTELNDLIKPDGKRFFPETLRKGVTLATTLRIGDEKPTQIVVPLSAAAQTLEPEELPSTSAPAYRADAKWFTLKKTLGPVQLDKVGVQYQDSTLRFLVNAALSAAGLTLSVDGLSFGSSLKKFDPQFELRGLGINYKNDAVEIGGAFLRTDNDSYDGAAVIKTKQFSLSALGSYTKLKGQHPSLFIYAMMNYPLGGPAFFFVNGLAAGFGYNRRLIAPSIENVAEFPLVKQAVGKPEDAPKDALTALASLRESIPPSVGDIFLAVGVKFNSFKLVNSFALLTFEFGSHFVINLLGVSTAVVPTAEEGKSVTPLAQVQIAWKASFDPNAGCLAIDARLTPNSYILSKDCHLSGGYAFYSWFSGDHAGDFVQTLGGYHPDFEKILPKHYPKVPRLAFDWRVSNSLTIQGDAYYALTGSALMAGGHLEVLFREGELRAWLKLGANFLIAWKPYHYDAGLHVSVGASYTFDINVLVGRIRTTISVDVGADLHLWGPDFSGTASIDISVISFTISFGAGASQKPPAITEWSIFQQSFLPEANVCSISVQDGLVRKMEKDGEPDRKDRWIINPKHLLLLFNSAIPFKSAAFANGSRTEIFPVEGNKDFGVRPMKKKAKDFESSLTIAVTKGDTVAHSKFNCKVIQKPVPKGLWDEEPELEIDEHTLLTNVPSAIEIKPLGGLDPGKSATIDLEVFQYSETPYYQGDDRSKDYAYFWDPPGGFKPPSKQDDAQTRRKLIEATVGSNPARDAWIKKLGVAADVNIKGNIVAGDFMSAPQIGKL